MSKGNGKNEQATPDAGQPASASTSKPTEDKWADPSIPIGNAPPLPRWPLGLAALAWLAWVLFLVIMMIERIRSSTI